MGALALGLALAFGLGGRGVAQQMLEDAYAKGREQRDQVKAEVTSVLQSPSGKMIFSRVSAPPPADN